MSDTRTVILTGSLQRRTATGYIAEAPDGYVVTLAPPKRNNAVNAALHAGLTEIAATHEWAGKKWDVETWKRLLVAAWSRANAEAPMILPALDGAGVDVVFRRTSKMTQAECRDLLGYIEAWRAA